MFQVKIKVKQISIDTQTSIGGYRTKSDKSDISKNSTHRTANKKALRQR